MKGFEYLSYYPPLFPSYRETLQYLDSKNRLGEEHKSRNISAYGTETYTTMSGLSVSLEEKEKTNKLTKPEIGVRKQKAKTL